MKRLLLIPICFVSLLIPVAVLASSGEGGFNSVVHSIESRYGVRATQIPFLGLISFISRKATHEGVGNLHVAEFEDFHATVDGNELNEMVAKKLGEGWERVVRETSHSGGEQTLVFMRPEGNRMGLFVVDLDSNEMDVVQVSVDPDHLDENVAHYGHHHHETGSDDGDHTGESN